jgi:hypothetical protein
LPISKGRLFRKVKEIKEKGGWEQPLSEESGYTEHAGRQGPDPRVNQPFIIAAHGHRNGFAKPHIDEAAIEVQWVRSVLHPEGNTFQEV